jgi:ABC-type multidrug transport system ATPase subunit
VVIGRSSEATLRLLHPTISRRHATVTRVGIGFLVTDHDSRFGTFVNGARVRTTTVRPDDRVQFGSALTYRVEADGLRRDDRAEGAMLVAGGLTISVPRDLDLEKLLDPLLRLTGAARDKDGDPQAGRKMLIKDISFVVRPDSFVGILGPSGAGKTTLLNCLASYLPLGRGRIVFDGQRDVSAESDAYRAMLGHVPQDDIVFRSLTVRENLVFAARLRLGREAGGATAAINHSLERVGMAEHADKLVAVLSGGQRKRLSVAVELLRRPRLLLLDEPTSGLDPASEANLMEQLRQVARRGTTVICTTHLMDNLRLLDEVVALGVVKDVGRLAYVGPPDGLLPHFRCRGFADLYEALTSGHFEPVAPLPSAMSTTAESAALPADGRVSMEIGLVEPRPHTDSTPTSHHPRIGQLAASWAADAGWKQFAVVTRRALTIVLRDRGLVLAMLAQPLLLGLLVCLTQYDADKLLPLLFFAVVVAIWLGLNNSARDLVRERRHYVRDRLAGLRPGAYLGAKTAVHAAVGAVQILTLMAILRFGCGVVLQSNTVATDLRAVSAIWLFLILMISYLGGVGLGLLTSTLVRTEEAAVALLPLLIMPQLLLSVVATGMQSRRYDEARPFRPLVVTLRGEHDLPGPAVLVDTLSMACLSRPAVLAAEAPTVRGYGGWVWLGDLCHLLVLLLATWTLVILAFHWAEQRWLRLIGL